MKRRKEVNFEMNQHLIKLKQLGADITLVNSKMCYIKFNIEGFELSYVYNFNKKGKYFLERLKPYPLPIDEYENEYDVIEIIKIDLEQYTSALNNYEIDYFVEINRKLIDTIKRFEDLFLYYKVQKNRCQNILEKIDSINNEIEEIQKNSERVFFDKDPDNLNID